jgi:hypothetical protein
MPCGSDATLTPLRRAAKLHAPQLGDLQLELLDLQRLVCTESSATFSSLRQARAKACSSAGSVGNSAVASDIAKSIMGHILVTIVKYESVLCQTSIGRLGSSDAIVRRQSIASISTANCGGVSIIAPSTIGGHTNRPFSSRLASSHRLLPSQYMALK